MFYIAIGLTILLLLLAILLAYLYKIFKRKEGNLVAGFENKGYNLDSSKVMEESIRSDL